MENFPQQDGKKKSEAEMSSDELIDDIQFEEVVDEPKPQEDEMIEDDDLIIDEPKPADEVLEEDDLIIDETPSDETKDDELIVDSESTTIDNAIAMVESAKDSVAKEIADIVTHSVDTTAKKYVIYIDPDNVPFMDDLSMVERREVINSILRDKNREIIEAEKIEARQRFIKNAVIAAITFVITFPLFFIAANKSMEVTMLNYEKARENFAKLYKKEGKVKMEMPKSTSKFKY